MTDISNGVPIEKSKERTAKNRLNDLLDEALSGYSSRSIKTILKEAKKVIEKEL